MKLEIIAVVGAKKCIIASGLKANNFTKPNLLIDFCFFYGCYCGACPREDTIDSWIDLFQLIYGEVIQATLRLNHKKIKNALISIWLQVK